MFTKRQQPVEKVLALNQQVEQFEKKVLEQQRKEKEQRQSEQIKMQIQLRDFETQLQQQQRRDFEYQQRESEQIQQQLRDYQQKVQIQQQQQQGLVGLGAGLVGEQQLQQQVRDYERMLVEKLQQDTDKRQRLHIHLQQKLKEFERLLNEQQQQEFQHLIRNQEKLRQIGNGNGLMLGGLEATSGQWQEKQQLLEQQSQEEKQLKQKQERLQKLAKEIESELNIRDIEQQKREVTGHIKSQQQQQVQQIIQQQQQLGGLLPVGIAAQTRIEQIQQLEQQLQEYKRILREKLTYKPLAQQLLEQQQQQPFGLPCLGRQQQQIQDCLTVEWIKQLTQKLRELEVYTAHHGITEKKLRQLQDHLAFLEQAEPSHPFYPFQQQLLKLKDLLEYNLPVECKQQFKYVTPMRQACQEAIQLIKEKIETVGQLQSFVEPMGIMPVDRLWSNLKTIEYQLRDLRQGGEYEPYWQQLHKKIFQLEQFVQQQQQQQQYFGGLECGPVQQQQKMEIIQDQIQQAEQIVQETLNYQRQVPLRVQVLKHQLQKHLIKRLIQVIEDIEAQTQEIKTPFQQQQQQPIAYQLQMAVRHLKGLKTQLRFLQQQQQLVVMQQRIQQLASVYESQLPASLLENRQHQYQLQQVTQALRCLEQQLIEQQLQVYQQQQQQQQCGVGLGAEEMFEQVKLQLQCQKQLQQAIREFAVMLIQQRQQIPQQLRTQTQYSLLQHLKEFENVLYQCNEVIADQDLLSQLQPQQQQQQGGLFQQVQFHHQQQQQQLQVLLRQCQQVMSQIQVPEQYQYVPLAQHQRLVNGLQQQIQQIQLQLQQQQLPFQQYPQLSWVMEQQQRQCVKRLQQCVQQLQQLQQLQPDLLLCQQQHILLQQAQQQLQQLYFIQQQIQKPQTLKIWQPMQQTQFGLLQQSIAQLRQQVHQVRSLQQQLRLQQECLPITQLRCIGGIMQPSFLRQQQQQQLIKSTSQPLLQALESQIVEQQQQEQQQYESLLLDQNNNGQYPIVDEANLEDIYGTFGTLREIEQENLVGELVQKYAGALNMPNELNQEYRRKIEQIYFENTRLGQLLRQKINEIGQLRKQFEELQTIRIKYPQQQPQQQWRLRQYPQTWTVMPEYETYSSLPIQQQQQQQITTTTTTVQTTEEPMMEKPSFKCVEQLINQLENKLVQLRIEGTQPEQIELEQQELYPTIRRPFGLQVIEPIVGGFIQTTRQQIPNGTQAVGQQTVIEVTKKQQTPSGQQVQTQTQILQEFKICPVCGIAVDKELSQPEFELHVNSHFPYTE